MALPDFTPFPIVPPSPELAELLADVDRALKAATQDALPPSPGTFVRSWWDGSKLVTEHIPYSATLKDWSHA